jgi:biopolymer transport protein TolR
MTRKHPKKHPIAEINVVPYIDVMLVLLIIFMITAPLLNQGVTVDLPQTSSSALKTQSKEPMIISIDSKGQYYLNIASTPSQAIDATTLINRVAAEITASKRQGQERQVFVKGDQHVGYGSVVELMALLQKSGATNIGLITAPTNSKPR